MARCSKVLPTRPGFCVICNITVERVLLSLTTFACSTVAFGDAVVSGICQRLPSAVRTLAVDTVLSTVDARAERFPSANQEQLERSSATSARERLAGFRDSWRKNNRSRILETFKIVQFHSSKISTKCSETYRCHWLNK